MRGILFLIVLLPIIGCARSTPLPGLHIDETGAIARTTPADVRARHEQAITGDLEAALGPDWQVAVQITPAPAEDHRYEDQRHWYWDAPTVRVSLNGPEGEAGLSTQAIGDLVGERLKPQLRHRERLTVQIER